MSRSRLALAAVLLVATIVTPAQAATKKPKPVCGLIKDQAGDAYAWVGAAKAQQTYDPSLDIVQADIGVGKTTIVAVIKVKDLTETSSVAPTGRTWGISMTSGVQSFGLSAYQSPLGAERFSREAGKFDYKAETITMSAKLSEIQGLKIVKGMVLRGFSVTTNVAVGWPKEVPLGYATQPSGTTDDLNPPSTATFKVGTLSCVKAA